MVVPCPTLCGGPRPCEPRWCAVFGGSHFRRVGARAGVAVEVASEDFATTYRPRGAKLKLHFPILVGRGATGSQRTFDPATHLRTGVFLAQFAT